jgi:hypothetical protein
VLKVVIYMARTKSKKINLDKLIGNNPKIDSQELARALQILGELRKQGINIGPNYNLGSPFSTGPHSNKSKPIGSVLRAM